MGIADDICHGLVSISMSDSSLMLLNSYSRFFSQQDNLSFLLLHSQHGENVKITVQRGGLPCSVVELPFPVVLIPLSRVHHLGRSMGEAWGVLSISSRRCCRDGVGSATAGTPKASYQETSAAASGQARCRAQPLVTASLPGRSRWQPKAWASARLPSDGPSPCLCVQGTSASG